MTEHPPTPPVPPTIPRTLRCANATLYAGSALLILAAGAWYISTHDSAISCTLAAAGCMAGLLWAAYYCRLRITIDQTGIQRRGLFSQRSIRWDTLTGWAIETTESQEQATCRLIFHSTDSSTPLIISSELIELDSVRLLARELQGPAPAAPAEDPPPTP